VLNLFKDGTKTKPPQIIALLRAYPKRKFILIGDSGEKDPETYAPLLRKYPKQISKIYIRNVTNARRNDARFAKVFAGISASKWRLFTDPSTLLRQ
jgi:phosphatidate phosphatase APP1